MDDSSKEPGAEATPDRRNFLGTTASLAMAGGMAAGYGTLGSMAARFLFPSQNDRQWLFVADVASVQPGASLPFESPTGVRVTIKRAAGAVHEAASVEAFIALSSVCPHLGCRVHWEGQNNRFFCPCHNGEFSPEGQATGGPPLAAGQALPQYPLAVENGLLFIEMPLSTIGVEPSTFVPRERTQTPHGE